MSLRLERVRELLKREVGEIIRRELPVNEAGLISVHEVHVAADLQHATVYVSILGGADQQKRGGDLLQERRWLIQSQLGKAIVMKYTPQLRFVIDDSIARGNRVLQILDELEKSPAVSSSVPEPSRSSTDENPPKDH